ncbi:hypothetical protein ACU4GD_28870 [Cupriavidus basilensis]
MTRVLPVAELHDFVQQQARETGRAAGFVAAGNQAADEGRQQGGRAG